MNATAFTRDEIDALLATAREQSLPEVTRVRIDGTIATLTVADRRAVEVWAERLDEPVGHYFGIPYVSFSQDGYEVRVTAGPPA